jgi:hypothetical protein
LNLSTLAATTISPPYLTSGGYAGTVAVTTSSCHSPGARRPDQVAPVNPAGSLHSRASWPTSHTHPHDMLQPPSHHPALCVWVRPNQSIRREDSGCCAAERPPRADP